jgi:hypothetical protein
MSGKKSRPARPIRADDPADDPPPPRRGMTGVWVLAAGLGGLLVGGILMAGAFLICDRRPPPVVEKPAVEKPAEKAEPKPKAEPKVEPKAPAGVNPAARPAIQWHPFADPDRRFTCAFPNGEPTKKPSPVAAALGTGSPRWERTNDGRTYSVMTVVVPPEFAAVMLLDDVIGTVTGGADGVPLTLNGVAGKQGTTALGSRTAITWTATVNKTTAVIVSVEGPTGLTPTDPAVKPFFDAVKVAR